MTKIDRVGLQPAYVLHQKPYRDSSLLLEVFTAQAGRVSLVAKGARRRTKRGTQSAMLQLFTPMLISYSGRSELKTVTAVEPAGGSLSIHGERMYSGLYVNELLFRLLHRHDPHPQLFASYCNVLSALADNAAVDVALRSFELDLLDELGYSLNLEIAEGEESEVDPARWYEFVDGRLVYLPERAGGMTDSAFLGAHLLAIAQRRFDPAVLASAKRLMRQALKEHLGSEPLRSRELFQAQRFALRHPSSKE